MRVAAPRTSSVQRLNRYGPLPSYFHNSLLRGNRATKVDASGLGAFASNNYNELAHVGIHMDVFWHRILPPPPPRKKIKVHTAFDTQVLIVRLFPGMQGACDERRRGVALGGAERAATATPCRSTPA